MTDDKSDTPAVAEFVMTDDCQVGHAHTVIKLTKSPRNMNSEVVEEEKGVGTRGRAGKRRIE
jgi:hypothetical protein